MSLTVVPLICSVDERLYSDLRVLPPPEEAFLSYALKKQFYIERPSLLVAILAKAFC